ncbi:Thiol-disulfide oxidoreductase ResA [termite gut metagenome]|uniref:Thiol-disulfide oxidoreductase ResA n=1 Tax=termite gut metagenome TaxID=433724 RepID=A0A5J4R0M0_9ZZZZ
MKMRKYFLLLFVVICLFGCNNNKTECVSITGNIKGLGDDTIYVYGVDEFFNFMDTIYVKDDKFAYTIQADTTDQIILLLNNRHIIYPVFFDKEGKITIEGDTSHLEMPIIMGNPANENLTVFLQKLENIEELSEKELEEKVDSFIHKNQASPASVYLLDTYFVEKAQPDYTRIKQLIEAMSGKLRDKPYMEGLMAFVEQTEQAEPEKVIPSFNTLDINDKKVSYTTLDSKYILIHFWASWDDKSRQANAELRKINRIYTKKERRRIKKKEDKRELSILGISLDVEKESWKQTVKKDTLTWTQVCDLSGWNSNIIKQYAVREFPANILINSTGKVIARNIERDSLSVRLPKLLEER